MRRLTDTPEGSWALLAFVVISVGVGWLNRRRKRRHMTREQRAMDDALEYMTYQNARLAQARRLGQLWGLHHLDGIGGLTKGLWGRSHKRPGTD